MGFNHNLNHQEQKLKGKYLEYAAKVWRQENTDGPIIVAIHGWLDNAASFDSLVEKLSPFKVVAIDLPGHGFSEHLPTGDLYTINHYLHAVLDLIDLLTNEPVILLGHSLGGAISSLIAALCPHKVQCYITIDFIGTLSNSADKIVEQWRHSLVKQQQNFNKKPTYYSSIEKMVELRMRLGDIPQLAAKAIILRNAKSIDDEFTWRSDVRLRLPSPYYFMEEQCLALLKSIQAPGLYFIASETYLQYKDLIDVRCNVTPNLQVDHMQGRHYLHVEQAGIMADKIKQFLNAANTI